MTYEETVRDTLKRLEELNLQMRTVYNAFPHKSIVHYRAINDATLLIRSLREYEKML